MPARATTTNALNGHKGSQRPQVLCPDRAARSKISNMPSCSFVARTCAYSIRQLMENSAFISHEALESGRVWKV